jgi:hypothetical protein
LGRFPFADDSISGIEVSGQVALGIWEFTAAAFAPHVGEIFAMHPAEGEAIRFELVNAKSYGRRPPLIPGFPQRQDSFSLLFRSADGHALGRGLYTMKHPEFEAIGLHAERVQPPFEDQKGVYYEVVFN